MTPADQTKWLKLAEKNKLSALALRESIKRNEVVRGAQGKGTSLGVSDILDAEGADGKVVLGPAAVALNKLLKRLPTLMIQKSEDAKALRLWIQRLEPFAHLQTLCRERFQVIGQPLEPPTDEPKTTDKTSTPPAPDATTTTIKKA